MRKVTITIEVDEASVKKTSLATWQDLFESALVDYAEVCEAIAVHFLATGDNFECIYGSPVIESK